MCKKKYEGKSSQLLPLLVPVQDWIFLEGGTQQNEDEHTEACFKLSPLDQLFNAPIQS